MALTLTSLIATSTLRLALNFWFGQSRWMTVTEQMAMFNSAQRIVREDVHAATSIGTIGEQLVLSTAGGIAYRYFVNAEGQYVRVQNGGGTTILAAGVRAVQVSSDAGTADLLVTFQSGQRYEIYVSSLVAVMP